MKRTVIFLCVLLSLHLSYSQTTNQLVTDAKGNKKLLGPIDREGLNQEPFAEWFNKNYDAYLINDRVVKAMKDSLSGYHIKVFLGTWCGDSKREVPRFFKILDDAQFPSGQLEVIALDREANAYKQSPSGEEKGLNIHRVPAFIFYKDGKEVNRIVEYPVMDLERDILTIVSHSPYTPNYRVVSYVHNLLSEHNLDALRDMEQQLISKLAETAKGSRELNTYGYVLLRANDIAKAIYVFELNTKIYPYKYNTYDSLGEAYFEAQNYAEALAQYNKVLELMPNDENAKAMIEKIKGKME